MTRTLCHITNTKLKKKNSLIFHIRYTINGVEKYTQYKANKHTRCCTLFEGDSCSVSLHRKPECTNEISPIVKRDFYEEIRAFFKKNPSCSNTTAINYVKVLINLI